MKQTNRSIYRDGYIRFENLIYKGENLAGYAGEQVALRYDPSDITQVLIYRREEGKDVFLARAFAQDLETETLSLEEIKAANKKIRDRGKSISNQTILEEVKAQEEENSQDENQSDKDKAQEYADDLGKIEPSNGSIKNIVKIWERNILKLPVASNLDSKAMLKVLASATGGYIGLLDMILRETAVRSLEKGLKKIDLATLKEVAGEYK